MSKTATPPVGQVEAWLDPAQRRYLRVQLLAGVPINAALGALFVWMVFGGQQRVGLWGGTGLAADLVPTTFMITLMTTIGLTLATRAAVRSGKLRAASGPRAPRNPVLRGVVFAAAATLMLVPVWVLLLWAIWGEDWSYDTVLWFKIAYAIGLGLLITPTIVRAALADKTLGTPG